MSGMIITVPFEWPGSYEELVLYESLVSPSPSSSVQMKERHFYFPIKRKEKRESTMMVAVIIHTVIITLNYGQINIESCIFSL